VLPGIGATGSAMVTSVVSTTTESMALSMSASQAGEDG
jgi:hypothetical protein